MDISNVRVDVGPTWSVFCLVNINGSRGIELFLYPCCVIAPKTVVAPGWGNRSLNESRRVQFHHIGGLECVGCMFWFGASEILIQRPLLSHLCCYTIGHHHL